jgi:hypothetical protein
MITPTDRLDGGPADYKIPTGDYLNPGRTAPMPVPRQIDIAGTNVGEGSGDDHATQDTLRRSPSTHPALK